MDRSVLSNMTVKMLRVEAERLGVKRLSALKKNELIEAILDASTIQNEGLSSVDGETSAASNIKNLDEFENKASEANEEKAVIAVDSKEVKNEDGDVSEQVKKQASVKTADGKKSVSDDVESGEDEDSEDEDDENGEDSEEDKDSEATESVSSKDGSLKSDKKKASKKLKKANKVVEVEPAPVEPSSIFIDHGAILPEYVPGTCLYALVRDPGTLFVYWNANFESESGWILTAYDVAGTELQSFITSAKRNGRGYFRIPTARVARVTLRPNMPQGSTSFILESQIRIAQQLGIAQPKPAYDERWVDVENHEVVYEAPAPGRAPAFHEVYQTMSQPSFTAGGFDRSVEMHNTPNQIPSTSSRFGSLNAPGSSDTLIGSSERLTRK